MATFYQNENEIKILKTLFPEFMVLYIYVDPSNSDLHNLYVNSVQKHNHHLFQTPDQFNSGFDMFVTEVQSIANGHMRLIDFKVACAAKLYKQHRDPNEHYSVNTGFYVYPRSSISKTELRLANNVGIIDSGYRGNLMGYFDSIPNSDRYNPESPEISFGNRITQICAPGLQPIYVIMVDSREELGETERGRGGFGSTGR
jgi:dUTP pyrophosphatase